MPKANRPLAAAQREEDQVYGESNGVPIGKAVIAHIAAETVRKAAIEHGPINVGRTVSS